MLTAWKRIKTASAFVCALSLILPSLAEASVAQTHAAMRVASVPYSSPIDSVGVTRIDQRSDRRYRDNRQRRSADRQRGARRDNRGARVNVYRNVQRGDGHRSVRRVQRQRHGYRNGYRGSRAARRGYRRDSDGFWYPLAAFALGAVILNELNNNQPQRQVTTRGWSHIPAGNLAAHDAWCDQKYRSYRRSDKTFQPYNGPRRYCNSPYDGI
ncbi:BA14K family protein [uncultured Sulfitobacter sp.]|uniref:BA14K family protein n=1 Tax=uncultured Sulfitobacter sp. TaxID=191468 RepID=UPI002625231F|nr:BA14K family protein [uncultured Sulfitobacter sp.]